MCNISYNYGFIQESLPIAIVSFESRSSLESSTSYFNTSFVFNFFFSCFVLASVLIRNTQKMLIITIIFLEEFFLWNAIESFLSLNTIEIFELKWKRLKFQVGKLCLRTQSTDLRFIQTKWFAIVKKSVLLFVCENLKKKTILNSLNKLWTC